MRARFGRWFAVDALIVYRMNPLTYALARSVSDVPHIGMANLIVKNEPAVSTGFRLSPASAPPSRGSAG